MTRADQTSNNGAPGKLHSRPRSQNGLTRPAKLARSANSASSAMPPSASSSPGHRARSRKGYALASARDRTRLRERSVAERDRVEKMLATAPLPDDRRGNTRDPHGNREELRHLDFGRAVGRTAGLPCTCPVCGDSRIVTDEVIHGGTLSMSECLHCDHRWTARPKARWVDLGARMNRAGRSRSLATA